ncbi:MAG TPA: type VI secretion system tube protein Hcp [Fimbriimonas sp.]|nr:type VI secretion system tube protein Hcp [Fimbriimonas sp.]
MKIGNLMGESTAAGFVDWFDVMSFSWGLTQASGRATLQDVHITKSSGRSSPALMVDADEGALLPAVQIVFVVNDQTGKPQTYERISLSDVLITSFSLFCDGSRPTETLTLSFSKLEFDKFDYRADGGHSTEIGVVNVGGTG